MCPVIMGTTPYLSTWMQVGRSISCKGRPAEAPSFGVSPDKAGLHLRGGTRDQGPET